MWFWLSWISLTTTSISQPCWLHSWRLFPGCETDNTGLICGVVSVFLALCFSLHLLSSTAVRLWRRGISTGTRSASCALTVTSTSNRRATSSWRGSCTAKLMQGLARGPQRATTQLLFTPKLNSVLHRPEHARTHAHLHRKTAMALGRRIANCWLKSKTKAFRRLSYCYWRKGSGRQVPALNVRGNIDLAMFCSRFLSLGLAIT